MAQRDINKFIDQVNIANELDEETLKKISQQVHEGYLTDLQSRSHWDKQIDEWTKLAIQVRENKTWPWPKASNVKFPILATAAMQFSARAYPTLIPADGKLVKVEVIGKDLDGQKRMRADRIATHMSYQIMKEMQDWEEDMDKLFLILPIVGTCFKKTYWDGVLKQNCSRLIVPKDLIINYWARSLETAERISERIEMSPRIFKERQLAGLFLDIDLKDPPQPELQYNKNKQNLEVNRVDETTPHIIIEQHTYYDLDDDGYPEPYIITFSERTRQILRLVARYDASSLELNEKKEVVKINPIQYYTKYTFIPNPDGGFYDIGFGLLLGTLNESVNTIINQLIDAGTLSNLQSGYIGKSLRIKLGDSKFQPGEWKPVNATGDDLKKQIFPLPVREPSNVLFQLLGMLAQSSKELASVAEIFVGKMPGQNTPATTTMATIEQGMKVFTAIYKRVYRSLQREFKKLYRLNGIYLDTTVEQNIVDEQIGPQDYESKSYDVCPSADPQATTKQEKLVKAQALMELLQLGTIDPMAVTLRILEAQEQENPESLLPKGPPPPDPKIAIEQMKAQMEQQKMQYEMQLKQQEAQMKEKESQLKMQMDGQMHAQKLQFEEAKMMLEMKGKMAEHQLNVIQRKDEMEMDKQEHRVEMVKGVEKHSQDMEMSKEKHEKDMSQKKEKSKE